MLLPARRLLSGFLFFVGLNVVGGAGYYYLGGGRWHLFDCIYMAIITVATVGYGELNQMNDIQGARGWTVFLIVLGIGSIAYMQANLTTLLVEGELGEAIRRRRMQKKLAHLSNHVVVAGAGSTGKHVLEELIMTRTPFVVIDQSLEVLEKISADLMGGNMLYVHGDATDDHALISANVGKASGVVAALTHDKDNLFVTVSARALNPKARIVSKINENEAGPKMMKAGATSVVNPTKIGGFRLASELIRPDVNEFLDQMLRDREKKLRLEEVTVLQGSSFVGKTLRDTPIRQKTGLLVVAVRQPDRTFIYNPDSDYVIREGTTLIVMGETDGVVSLRALVNGSVESAIG